MNTIRTEIVNISPSIAAQWLKNMAANRSVRRSRVKALSADMSEGRWKITHQSVALDQSGRLIDGQHRLLAVIESGKTVPMLVAFCVNADAMGAIDIGAQRDGRDVAVIAGVTEHSVHATWTRALLKSHESNPTPTRVAEVIPLIRDQLDAFTEIFAYHRRGSRSGFAAAFVLAHYSLSNEVVSLARRVVQNDALAQWTGLWWIRRKMDEEGGGGDSKIATEFKFVLRCLEIELSGRKVKVVRGEADVDGWWHGLAKVIGKAT